MDYISMPDGFLGEQNYQKKEILHNQTVGIYFQKRIFIFFTRKTLPKKEILMAYVSGP